VRKRNKKKKTKEKKNTATSTVTVEDEVAWWRCDGFESRPDIAAL